jgi:hypothetical protein
MGSSIHSSMAFTDLASGASRDSSGIRGPARTPRDVSWVQTSLAWMLTIRKTLGFGGENGNLVEEWRVMRAFRRTVLAALMALPLVSAIGCGSSASSSPTTKPMGPAEQEALQREAMKSLNNPGKGVTKAGPIAK